MNNINFIDMTGGKGKDGADGKSAYEIAVEKGYNGTEEEWIADSLKKVGVDDKDTQGFLSNKLEATYPLYYAIVSNLNENKKMQFSLNFDTNELEVSNNKLTLKTPSHTHSNKNVLDLLTEKNGVLAYKDKYVAPATKVSFMVRAIVKLAKRYYGAVNRDGETARYNYLTPINKDDTSYNDISIYSATNVYNEETTWGKDKNGNDLKIQRFKFPKAGIYKWTLNIITEVNPKFTDDWLGFGLIKCNDTDDYDKDGSMGVKGISLTSLQYNKIENANRQFFNYSYEYEVTITDLDQFYTLGLQSIDNIWLNKISMHFELIREI